MANAIFVTLLNIRRHLPELFGVTSLTQRGMFHAGFPVRPLPLLDALLAFLSIGRIPSGFRDDTLRRKSRGHYPDSRVLEFAPDSFEGAAMG